MIRALLALLQTELGPRGPVDALRRGLRPLSLLALAMGWTALLSLHPAGASIALDQLERLPDGETLAAVVRAALADTERLAELLREPPQ